MEITRREFLGAAAGTVWFALAGTLGCEAIELSRATASPARAGQAWSFRSRPDLKPPVLEVTTQAHDTAPGYVFCAPKNGPEEAGPGQDGCLILDDSGQPVWFRPVGREAMDAMDFKLQSYRGREVLTWWEGEHTGFGKGEYVIADSSYREVARVRAGNGYDGDHHEFLITPKDTALITIYNKVPGDSVPVGDPVDGNVLDGIAQEVDIETGEALFEWHSLEHVGLDNSYTKPYDYFHINSIDVYDEDHLLISSRNTCTVYKVDRKTGKIVWRLGGKTNDFEMAEGTQFAFQHDARRHPDGTITIFDNGYINREEQSRGIVVEVDEDKMSATLAREYTYPDKLLSETQGNVQVLPNGNAFVGWGSAPDISEFNRDGELLFSAAFPTEGETYRAFRFPWSGQPTDDPAVAAESGSKHEVTLYTSWNGATEVDAWQVLAGSGPDELELLASAPHKGFETVITVHTTKPYVGLKAMNNSGKVLGTTRTITLEDSA